MNLHNKSKKELSQMVKLGYEAGVELSKREQYNKGFYASGAGKIFYSENEAIECEYKAMKAFYKQPKQVMEYGYIKTVHKEDVCVYPVWLENGKIVE